MSDYRFNSQTVADKLGAIIDTSIGYVSKKQQKDKTFRGITGNVSSTTADVYLFGSNTPIPNVKIGSGIKHLFAGEDVYLTAIGGRLDNAIIDKRVIDYDLVYEDEIDNFRTIDDFSKTTYTWTCDAPTTATMISANDYYRVYTASKKTNYLTKEQLYYFSCSPSNLDLTKFQNSETSSEDDVIYFSFYMGTGVEYLAAMGIFFFNGSNLYSFILPAESISSGWNRVKQAKSSFTNSGMTNWSGIDKITIAFAYIQPVELDYYVNFAYLGMAKLHVPSVVSTLTGSIDSLEDALDTTNTNLGNTQSDVSALTQRVITAEGDISSLESGKQDVNSLLTDIISLSGTGLLAKSSLDIYSPTINATANQTSISFNPVVEGNITVGFATDYLKLFTKNARFGVLYTDYSWNTDYVSIELGSGASLAVPSASAETNEFFILNNLYKSNLVAWDKIFYGSGSGIVLKRDELNFVVTDTPSFFYDSSYLKIRKTYSADTPLSKVQISDKYIVSQNNLVIRTSVLDWYTSIYKYIQVGDTGSMFAYVDEYKNINIAQNLYCDNTTHTYLRIEDDPATMYQQRNGEHIFFVAGDGEVGSEVTLTSAFKIANDGNLYFGTRKFTISDTEPSTPAIGDLWLDTSTS